jgi:hypothetical protein
LRDLLFLHKETRMPTLSMFFGIIIRMYYAPKEHNPPHIHVYYQEFNAVINIADCTVTQGKMPSKQLRLVTAWIELRRKS